MYLLEGTAEVQQTYKTMPGDVLIFSKLSDGSLLVCGRRGTKDDVTRKTPAKRSTSDAAGGSSGRSKGAGHSSKSKGGETIRSKRLKQKERSDQLQSMYAYW